MNERTAVLSAQEREVGFRNFMKHITWNGLGVFLVNQTIVSLMAIHFGASNLELGYIGSAFHVAGLASLFIPRIFRGFRINKLFGWGWMIRGFVAVLYVFLLFMSDVPARIFILVVFTAFCLSRTVGFSVAHAVQRDFMRSRDTSGSLVRLNIRLAWSQLASQLLSFALLSIALLEGILGLIVIALIGAVMNTVASWYLLKVPGRGVVEPAGDRNTFQTFVWSMKRREHAIPLLVHGLGMGLVVLFGFQVVFFRRVLGLPNNIAILLVVLEAVSAIIANSALKPFADSIGDKPLLFISTAGLTVVALIWAFIPGTLPIPVYFGLGFVAFLFKRSLLTLKGSVMVKSIPERNRVAYTSAANVMLALIALLIGLVGGGLADLAAALPGAVVHDYTLTFLFTAVLAALTAGLCARLPGERNMSLRETADIMLSARNLRAFLDAYQLDFAADPAQRETLLLSLERSPTTVATSRIRERLRGPLVSEKERVLRTLFRSPRPELLDDIIAEARDPASYTRREAIFCLGAYHEAVSERVLREIAGLPVDGRCMEPEDDIEAVAISLKSLARLTSNNHTDRGRNAEALERIRELLSGPLPARSQLDLRLAESILDPHGPQLRTLFTDAAKHGSERYAATCLLISLNRLDIEPGIENYLRAEARAAGRGFDDLIEDASEFVVIQAQRAQLLRWLSLAEYGAIWRWMAEHLSASEVLERDTAGTDENRWRIDLARAIREVEPSISTLSPGLARLLTLAGIYTFHGIL